MKPISYWVDHLNLQPHPEGGFFSETYRSSEAIAHSALPGRFSGDRSCSTAIYFLVEAGKFSSLHRIQSDELWHFYTGAPLLVSVIHPDGRLEDIRLGANPENGEVFQAVVPAGAWFGSRLLQESGYALVGCTVAPGFDFADFELATRVEMLNLFPQHRSTIEVLTHP